MNNYNHTQLFFQKYIYLIDNEKNWSKAEYLVDNLDCHVDVDEAVIKALKLRNKLELSKTNECLELVEYFIDIADKITNEELKDIVLCNLFDYGFRLLANEYLYNKLDNKDSLAMTAAKALNIVSTLNTKTYRSHIIQIFNKLQKAKEAGTSYTSNYILANYYMVMNPFRKKYVVLVNEIRRVTEHDAHSFISNN